jgi:hypothetical protein
MASVSSNDRPPMERDPELGEGKVDDPINTGGVLEKGELHNADGSSITSGEDILAMQDVDPALNMKMHLVNNVSDLLPLW